MPAPTTFENQADRFWSKVDRSGDCWLWTGYVNPAGYGIYATVEIRCPAHKMAWFLVMGVMPERLYRTCGNRGCVRPHHLRDEASPLRTRWNWTARDGFPFEFREFAPQLLSTHEAEKELEPLLLHQGNLTTGRAQALFNFTLAAQHMEAQRVGDLVMLSKGWPDLSHSVGLHRPITAIATVEAFWGRMLQDPQTLELRPGMRDYVLGVFDASERRVPGPLPRIDRYSIWSTREWRRQRAPGWRVRRPTIVYEPVTEVWPFLTKAEPTEHDLLMAVDAVVPKTLPETIRQDVCQDLILAVLEGTVPIAGLAESAGEYTKQVFAQYPLKYGLLSLDAPAPWSEDSRTLGDTLAAAPVILGHDVSSLAALRDRLVAEEQAA